MTAKEKAKAILLSYMYKLNDARIAKRCALIAVEFAKENPLNTNGYNKYLDELKQEIEKL